ncbi:MAG: hypothetical protein P4L84_33035 [Isosphaeraceae bacterium]|nr:hypothetical protein [Isosphaeraceae bacterium]
MDEWADIGTVVVVTGLDNVQFRTMATAVESPGVVGSRIKIASAGTKLTARGSQMLDRWINHSPVVGVPGTWAFAR